MREIVGDLAELKRSANYAELRLHVKALCEAMYADPKSEDCDVVTGFRDCCVNAPDGGCACAVDEAVIDRRAGE